ncbi:hypothetical protein CDD83_10306 [Cordyceps sp. RAO-2017]|nr:hypothetical protein CDD83_10306 [Cordyceps sp. RAO-2017]
MDAVGSRQAPRADCQLLAPARLSPTHTHALAGARQADSFVPLGHGGGAGGHLPAARGARRAWAVPRASSAAAAAHLLQAVHGTAFRHARLAGLPQTIASPGLALTYPARPHVRTTARTHARLPFFTLPEPARCLSLLAPRPCPSTTARLVLLPAPPDRCAFSWNPVAVSFFFFGLSTTTPGPVTPSLCVSPLSLPLSSLSPCRSNALPHPLPPLSLSLSVALSDPLPLYTSLYLSRSLPPLSSLLSLSLCVSPAFRPDSATPSPPASLPVRRTDLPNRLSRQSSSSPPSSSSSALVSLAAPTLVDAESSPPPNSEQRSLLLLPRRRLRRRPGLAAHVRHLARPRPIRLAAEASLRASKPPHSALLEHRAGLVLPPSPLAFLSAESPLLPPPPLSRHAAAPSNLDHAHYPHLLGSPLLLPPPVPARHRRRLLRRLVRHRRLRLLLRLRLRQGANAKTPTPPSPTTASASRRRIATTAVPR